MRQRHIADAERAILAQDRKASVDLVAAFDADQARGAAARHDPADVRRRRRQRKRVRIGGNETTHHVDLLERHLDRLGAGDVRGDPHRPELPADMPRLQPDEIGLQRTRQIRPILARDRDVAALIVADLPGEIVMPIDHRRAREHALGARRIRWARRGLRQSRPGQRDREG